MVSETRNRLHQLIDRLPEGDLPALEQYLAYLTANPILRALAIASTLPEEELSAEEAAAVDEGLADLDAGRTVSLEEARRRLGA